MENVLLTRKGTSIFDEYYQLIDSKRLYFFLKNEIAIVAEKTISLIERNLQDINELKPRSILNIICFDYLNAWYPIYEELIFQEVFIKSFSYNTIVFSNLIYNSESFDDNELFQILAFFNPYRGDILNYYDEIKDLYKENAIRDLSNNYEENFRNDKIIQTLKLFLEKKKETISLMLSKFFSVMLKENEALFNELNVLIKKEKIGYPYLRKKEIQENNYEPIETPHIRAGEESDSVKGLFRVPYHFPAKEPTWNALTDINSDNENKFYTIIKANKIIELYKEKVWGDLEIEEIAREYNLEIFRETLNSKDFTNRINKLLAAKFSESSFWEIVIKVNDSEGSDFSFLLWTFIESLTKIDGVKIEIEEIGKGSLWAKIKAIFEDEISKEEFKDVLRKSKKALEAKYLDKEILDVKKTEKEIEGLPDNNYLEEKRKLELENIKLDNERLSIENKLKKLELLKGISDLMKQGLLMVDSDFQILINEILFTGIENGKLLSGKDLNIIQASEVYIEKKEEE